MNHSIKRQPFSLNARTLLVTGLTLMVLLGAVGFSLDRAFTQSSIQDEQSRLHEVGLMLLARLMSDENGKPIPPQGWVENLKTPTGNVYVDAQVLGKNGWHITTSKSPEKLWSPIQKDEESPNLNNQAVLVNTKQGTYYLLTQRFNWISRKGTFPVRLQVSENAINFQVRIAEYRRTMLLCLVLLATVLLVLQWILLRWSLKPINLLADNIQNISNGKQQHIQTSSLPLEIQPLGEYINGLIHNNHSQLSRYRHTCADLAHSLRTPLAVMRTQIEDSVFSGAPPISPELINQIERMDKLVTCQLSRAATSGHSATVEPIFAFKHAESVATGLEKLYAARQIYCEFEIDEKALFYGSEGDLLDLIGNLLENAFKWAKGRVLLRIATLPGKNHPGLLIGVEDDGVGVDLEKINLVLSRGGRADEKINGQGLGLSTVQDLVKIYHAEFEIGTSEEMGGACFIIRFPG